MDDEQLSQLLGFDVTDSSALEKAIFTSINEGNRVAILNIFQNYPSSTSILQILLTTTYPNKDHFYTHDPEVIRDADELLGESLENLNAIQIACILGEEDLAMDILQFVNDFTEEINAKKILFEFMGRIWGDGNTTLHLASFMGMSDLVQMMIELGAAVGKSNNRKYKPVDCAGDDITRSVFETVIEIDRAKRKNVVNGPTLTDLVTASPQGSQILSPQTPKGNQDGSPSLLAKKLEEEEAVVKGHTKSSSLDSGRRSPASSKTRRSRAGTVSNQPFKVDSLTRTDSSQSSLQKKPKKTVKFDKGVLLLHLCQYSDGSQESIDQVYACLGIKPNETTKSTFDVNNLCLPQQWLSPLHLACSHGRLEIVKILLTRTNAAVNIRDKEGWTPLHCASAEGHIEVINLLGKCQGSAFDADQSNKNWIYVFDGPIDLVPLNDDDDLPEDVALESKQKEIKAIFKGRILAKTDLLAKYPPKEVKESEEEEMEEEQEKEESAPLKKSFSDNLKRMGSVMKSSMRHQKREEDQNDEEEPEVKSESKSEVYEPQTAAAPIAETKTAAKAVPVKEPLKDAPVSKNAIQTDKKDEPKPVSTKPEATPVKKEETSAKLQQTQPIQLKTEKESKPLLRNELKATEVRIDDKSRAQNEPAATTTPTVLKENNKLQREEEKRKTTDIPPVTIPQPNTQQAVTLPEKEIVYEPEIVKTPLKAAQKTSSTSELRSPLRIEIVKNEEEQQPQVSFEQWKAANKHIMLGSPMTPKTPTDGSRKERLSYLRTKAKPNNELDLESAKHSVEQMRRPVELQRRSSKSNRDRPTINEQGSFGPSYYMNEHAPTGKVDSMKKAFAVEKEKSNGSIENLGGDAALPRMVSSVKDKIKMFQPSQKSSVAAKSK
ncbi:hypothetical protein HK103_006165 [Boothiomyces macroporosus]|uniref:Ankyrin repeat protein n=1 Tax=Boothiomyces macroporosus TaxID=261099 RepID=A0AAD5UHA2_9FUNG|nr:hypothetical protein HK103_006165 [Boothiomyces macroporosus]